MLTIRTAHMTAFENGMLARWVVEHVQRHFPDLGLAPDMIAASLARGRSYGFQKPADLCRFVDLRCALGEHFDRDPRLPWAARLLNAPEIADPTERMDLLAAAARAQLRAADLAGQSA
jgi:hypothetical protein